MRWRHARRVRSAHEGITRTKLMVLLPLTIALLVGATGFFTLSMAERFYVLNRPDYAELRTFSAQIGVQIALIALVSAVIGLSIAIGIARPVRQMAQQLGAVASGDLRGTVEIRSVSELDSLAGAFNTAIDAVNRHFFDGLSGAILTMSPDGTVIGASTAVESILGSREEDLIGRRLGDVLKPASGSRAALAAVEHALLQRHPVAIDDLDIIGQGGQSIRVGVTVAYLRRADASGGDAPEVVGVLITFKDVTEIRRLRDRLRQADNLVALGTVTAGVAHELRNPLASLRGLAELLGRDFHAGDPRTRYVTTMLDAIDRLNRMIEDLLLFSAPSPAVTESLDVASLVREVALFARHGADGKAVDVDGADAGIFVTGSRDRLAHAFANIVGNAVEATPAGGAVSARIEATHREAIVRIHNTGSYIPPDVRAQLFVPFFTTKPSGTGLGLAIARQFITAADGRIDVDSDPAGGTTFSIALPRAPHAAAAADGALAFSTQVTRA